MTQKFSLRVSIQQTVHINSIYIIDPLCTKGFSCASGDVDKGKKPEPLDQGTCSAVTYDDNKGTEDKEGRNGELKTWDN